VCWSWGLSSGVGWVAAVLERGEFLVCGFRVFFLFVYSLCVGWVGFLKQRCGLGRLGVIGWFVVGCGLLLCVGCVCV